MKLKDIKPNPNNPRVLRDDKFQKLKQSITEFPKMLSLRPMVIDENNVVLGGNMRLRALQELGFTDIDEAWVKRSSDLTEEEKKRFIIADNVAFGEWDWDTLANDWEVVDLEAWGLDIPQFDTVEELEASEDKYTQKIDTPVYEPKNEKPLIQELYNADKYKELVTNIENSSVTEEIKTLLKVAASRHIVFNYENMADFYAHSDKIVQQLMEDSALVIIDFNKAIELGFVNLSEEIAQQYQSEYGDE
jgi:hypothetical protein